MELKLIRKYKKDTYTVGILYIDGKYFSNTIEDKDRGLTSNMSLSEIQSKKVYGETAIPTGTYEISLNTISPKFKDRVWAKPYKGKIPRLLGVKGFNGILIHPLNTAKDSLGCIGVGENKIKGQIINSTKYFHKLMALLKSSTTPIKLIIE